MTISPSLCVLLFGCYFPSVYCLANNRNLFLLFWGIQINSALIFCPIHNPLLRQNKRGKFQSIVLTDVENCSCGWRKKTNWRFSNMIHPSNYKIIRHYFQKNIYYLPTRRNFHCFVNLNSFVTGILKTHHSSTMLNLNIFFSISFRKFLKVGGCNERSQWELSNKPIKSDFKKSGLPLFRYHPYLLIL